jgi:hypothetical protein
MRCAVLFFVLTLALAGLSFTEAKDSAAKGSEFVPSDLSGWEGLMDRWSYKDGAVVGSTFPEGGKFNTFLCSKKKYRDFEMTFKVKLTGKGWNGNSGVQIRSKVANPKTFAVHGPQADMGDGYWGSLYGEGFGGMMKGAAGETQKVVKKNDFNDYSIRCVGSHVTIKINGTTTVDDDFDKAWAEKGKNRQAMPEEGIIAFQLHAGGPMEVTFKDITFKELKSEK